MQLLEYFFVTDEIKNVILDFISKGIKVILSLINIL